MAVAALLSPVPSSAHRVGVDVVPTHHRADGAEDFVNTFCGEEDAAAVFTPREIRIIMEYPTLAERVRCVYLHWALKEAYTKATGVGIVDDLTRIEFRGVRFGWEERWTGASVWVDGVDMSSEWYLEVSFMPGRTAPGEGFYLAVCCSREAVGEEDLEGEWKELRLEDIANPVV